MVAAGWTDQEIADRLFVARQTVKTHLRSVFRKTESKNRVCLALWAIRMGLVEVERQVG